jgi:transcriptional regulator with XRE-family HTH domain
MDSNQPSDLTVKGLRESLGISQEELARRIKKSFRSVGDWETGRKIPRFDNAVELSIHLGVSLKTLAKAFCLSNVEALPDDYPLSLHDLKAVCKELGISNIDDLPDNWQELRRKLT